MSLLWESFPSLVSICWECLRLQGGILALTVRWWVDGTSLARLHLLKYWERRVTSSLSFSKLRMGMLTANHFNFRLSHWKCLKVVKHCKGLPEEVAKPPTLGMVRSGEVNSILECGVVSGHAVVAQRRGWVISQRPVLNPFAIPV